MDGICDIHSHILPGMDDGCKTVEESLTLLRDSFAQGVRYLAATPHYYPVESVEAFLERREKAWQSLQSRLEANMPQIILGAEVSFYTGLCYEERLPELCLGDTDCMLLEMPFAPWEGSVLKEVGSISMVRGITPIIAHIERYLRYQNSDTVQKLLDRGALIQMNGENLLGAFGGHSGRKLLKKGLVQFLGSDCHNTNSRPQNLGQAMQVLRKYKMEDHIQRITGNSLPLFGE